MQMPVCVTRVRANVRSARRMKTTTGFQEVLHCQQGRQLDIRVAADEVRALRRQQVCGVNHACTGLDLPRHHAS